MSENVLYAQIKQLLISTNDQIYQQSALLHQFNPTLRDMSFTNNSVDLIIKASIEVASMYAALKRTTFQQEIYAAVTECLFMTAATAVHRDSTGRLFAALPQTGQMEVHQWLQHSALLDQQLTQFAQQQGQAVTADAILNTAATPTPGRRRYSSNRVREVALAGPDTGNAPAMSLQQAHQPQPQSRRRARQIAAADTPAAAVYVPEQPVVAAVDDAAAAMVTDALAESVKLEPVIVPGPKNVKKIRNHAHVYDPKLWTAQYRKSGDSLIQSFKEGASVKAADHLFGNSFVASVAATTIPVDFMGAYSAQAIQSVAAYKDKPDVFETDAVVEMDELIVATNRHQADVIFRGELVNSGTLLSEKSTWQYYAQFINVPYVGVSKEQFENMLQETGLYRLVLDSELSKYTTLSQLAAVLRIVGAATEYPLNLRIVGMLDRQLTREINHFLQHHLGYREVNLDSFANDWDACEKWYTTEKKEDLSYIHDRLTGSNGYSNYANHIVTRALNIMPGVRVSNEAAAFYNNYVLSTKKHIHLYSLYHSVSQLVVHLPVMSYDLGIEFDSQSQGLLSREYAPAFYDMINSMYESATQQEQFDGLMLLVTNDDVEITVDYTSHKSHMVDDVIYNKYLLTVQ